MTGRQGLVAVPRIFPARVLPRSCDRPRQESYRGNASVFGKEPCRGLGGILGKGARDCLVFWSSSCLVGSLSSQRFVCHHGGASRALVPMWLMVLEPLGSRVARFAGVGQVAPARLLPGPRRPPQQGSCQGSPPRPLALCVSILALLDHLVASAPCLCPA